MIHIMVESEFFHSALSFLIFEYEDEDDDEHEDDHEDEDDFEDERDLITANRNRKINRRTTIRIVLSP